VLNLEVCWSFGGRKFWRENENLTLAATALSLTAKALSAPLFADARTKKGRGSVFDLDFHYFLLFSTYAIAKSTMTLTAAAIAI
jgi:hypothetical protein